MLDIEPIKQRGKFMCIPACLEMVIKFLIPDNETTQEDIIKRVFLHNKKKIPDDFLNQDSKISFGNIKRVLTELGLNLEVNHFDGSKINIPASELLNQVKYHLSYERVPVLLSLNLWATVISPYNWESGCCHIVVITGFKDESFFFSDPATNSKHKVSEVFLETNLSPSLDYLVLKNI